MQMYAIQLLFAMILAVKKLNEWFHRQQETKY
jgi:hypothetical protein